MIMTIGTWGFAIVGGLFFLGSTLGLCFVFIDALIRNFQMRKWPEFVVQMVLVALVFFAVLMAVGYALGI